MHCRKGWSQVAVLLLLLPARALQAEPKADSEASWLPVSFFEGAPPNSPVANTIQFGTRKSIRTQLVEVEHIGQLQEDGATPHFILAGRDCVECDMNTSLYIHNPDDGDLLRYHPRHAYPGRLFDYMNPDRLVEETRFFFGSCLPNRGSVAIWFVKWLTDTNEWKSGVFLLEKHATKLEEYQFKEGGPSLVTVEDSVAKGGCRELPGRDGHTEP